MESEIKASIVEHLKAKISPADADIQLMPEIYSDNTSKDEYLQHPFANIFVYYNGSMGGKRDFNSHTNTISIGITIYGISESHPRYGTETLAQIIRANLTTFYPKLESGVIESVEWNATDPLPPIDDGTILLGMKFNYNGIYFDGQ